MQPTRELRTTTNIIASVQTDTGCVREANEDNGRHIKPNDQELFRRKGTLTIVADGMGGHSSGEVASEMAVDLIGDYYYRDETRETGAALKNAVEEASRVIHETSLSDEKYFGMGTTVVALVLQNNLAYPVHVGDSRLYLLRGNDFRQITEDHSQVMEMVKYGIITREEAKNHDDKNVILRAMGTQAAVEAELSDPFVYENGDTFLLCSDGLSDLVEDYEMGEILLTASDIYEAGERLIDLAKERGGHDNITVGIVRAAEESAEDTNRNVRVTRELEAI